MKDAPGSEEKGKEIGQVRNLASTLYLLHTEYPALVSHSTFIPTLLEPPGSKS